MLTYPDLSLLIVDDELAIRTGLSRAMPWSDLGIQVIGCSENGEEALEMIRIHNPHIVITDIKMPICDGLKLIRLAKEEGYTCQFIIMSGYNDFKFAKEAIKFGVQNYLLKPIKQDELIETLTLIRDSFYHTHKKDKFEHTLSSLLQDLVHNKYKPSKDVSELYDTLAANIPLSIVVFDDDIPLGILKSELQSLIPSSVGWIFECDAHKLAAAIHPGSLSKLGYLDTHAFLKFITHTLSDRLETPLFCGIGDEVKELAFLFKSYHTANEYLSYKMYELDHLVFDETIISLKESCPLTIHNTYAESLAEAILAYNEKDIHRLTEAFFNWILYVPTPPPSFVRGMCIHLMIDIQKRLSQYDAIRTTILSHIPHEEILGCSTLSSIKVWLLESFISYATTISFYTTTPSASIIEPALEYIKENITSKLSLEEVASHVHLSKSYFTSLFKEKTGESFRNYILSQKIEYAKTLLKESDITASNLSYLLGYEEYRSFNRAFKKSTGKTPSEYHKIYSLIKNEGV